jgi:hypothetical protein
MTDYYANNVKLTVVLNDINTDDFYAIWQKITQELIYDSQFCEIFFSRSKFEY